MNVDDTTKVIIREKQFYLGTLYVIIWHVTRGRKVILLNLSQVALSKLV